MTLTRRHALGTVLFAPLTACRSTKASTHASTPTSASTSAPAPSSMLSTPQPPPPLRYPSLRPGADLVAVPHDAAHPQVAITLDDGVRSDVIAGYAELSRRADIRLTMFANGCYSSWAENKTVLAPLIESGQIVIGNHTFNHPNITKLNDAELAHQITTNEKHFKNLFGIDLKPFFRPPFGYINHTNRRVLRDLGYEHPVMWYGTFGDDQNITPATIRRDMNEWLTPGRIVIGHLNHAGTLRTYSDIEQIVKARHLHTVTIRDVMPVK